MQGNKKTIKIIGSFASEYSISKVNRTFAYTLGQFQDEYDVKIWADETIADKLPGKEEYKRYPFLRDIFVRRNFHAEVGILNNFPKSFSADFGTKVIDSNIRLVYIAWEESIFPSKWVDEFNENLHGILVASEHTKRVLLMSGVCVPIINISQATQLPNSVNAKGQDDVRKNKFTFLHISSGQYRKGADVLVNAFVSEFSDKDNIKLIIKNYSNVDSQTGLAIEEAKRLKPSSKWPEIELIDKPDLTDTEMKRLYELADAVVLPSRAEGFGLPMLEALSYGKPLITTGYSGQMDFCNSKNSILLDYQLVPSKSHLNIPGAMVAEPNLQDLRIEMRSLYENHNSAKIKEMIEAGLQTARGFTWSTVAQNFTEALPVIEKFVPMKNKSITILSTLNSKCGIAEYTKDLYLPIRNSFKDFKIIANSDVIDRLVPDQQFVVRKWNEGDTDFSGVIDELGESRPDIFHIQYHSAKFPILALGKLIENSRLNGMKVFVTLHDVPEAIREISSILNYCSKVFVHSESDLARIIKMGVNNGKHIIHGMTQFDDIDKLQLRKYLKINKSPIIASHGFIHTQKGLLETIEAVKILKGEFPNILYLALNSMTPNNMSSSNVYKEMVKLTSKLGLEENVLIFPEFLTESEILHLLSLADVNVLAYSELNEGASGAIRKCLATLHPIITTQLAIFDDVKDITYRIKGNEPGLIAEAVKNLLKDRNLYTSFEEKVKTFVKVNSWLKAAEIQIEDF